MMNQAMDKLRDEMAAHSDNPNVQRIGEYLSEYVQAHPSSATAFVISEGKSIDGALKALEEYARKQPRTGNCAMVDDQTAFGVILRYYGIPANKPEASSAKASPAGGLAAALDLDALLGL